MFCMVWHTIVFTSHIAHAVTRRDWPYARQDVTDHMHVPARAGRARERQGVSGSVRQCRVATCVFKTGFWG